MTLRFRLLLFAHALWALPTTAQLNQYTLPGNFARDPVSNVDRVARALEESRWRFGKLQLDPWLSLRNLAYTNRGLVTGDEKPDLTATLGAGLRAYLPLGGEVTAAAHALPEYVWWRDSIERRRLNGRFGAGLFANLGRIVMETSATRNDGTRFFSREFEEQVDQREDSAELSLEVALMGGVSAVLEGSVKEFSLLEDQDERFTPLSTLDREQRLARVGLRYRFVRGLRVGLGVEEFRADFEQAASATLRDATGEALFLDFLHGTPVWTLRGEVAYQLLDAGQEPTLSEKEGLRARFHFAWKSTRRLVLELYGNQNLVFSFQQDTPFFEDRTLGLGARTSLRSWASFRVFVEGGDLDFTNLDPSAPRRIDDFDTVGADLRIGYRGFSIILGVTRTEYESTLPQFDRTVETVRSSVGFGYRGLSVGSEGLTVRTGELSPWG